MLARGVLQCGDFERDLAVLAAGNPLGDLQDTEQLRLQGRAFHRPDRLGDRGGGERLRYRDAHAITFGDHALHRAGFRLAGRQDHRQRVAGGYLGGGIEQHTVDGRRANPPADPAAGTVRIGDPHNLSRSGQHAIEAYGKGDGVGFQAIGQQRPLADALRLPLRLAAGRGNRDFLNAVARDALTVRHVLDLLPVEVFRVVPGDVGHRRAGLLRRAAVAELAADDVGVGEGVHRVIGHVGGHRHHPATPAGHPPEHRRQVLQHAQRVGRLGQRQEHGEARL
ncbi:hypothetical protein D3C81_555010 [compost metagenome]